MNLEKYLCQNTVFGYVSQFQIFVSQFQIPLGLCKTKNCFIYTVVLFLLISIHLYKFSTSPLFCYCKLSLYFVHSFLNCNSHCLFRNTFTSFRLYDVIKCSIPYSEQGLQFPASVTQLTHSFVSFCLFVSGRRSPFNISCNAGLVMVNSLSFCMSGKAFILSFISKGWS